jgi:integrase/recombinase XerD
MTEPTIYEVVPTQANPRGKDLTKRATGFKQDFRKYWSKELIQSRLEKVTNHKDKMLLMFLWMSGVRITEALGLNKQDFDFKNFVMRIKWLKNRKYNERMVPIHPRLKDILELYTAAMKQEESIFPYSRQRAWQIVQKWMGGYPHQFRHSFAVNWLQQGGDIVILHRILGHSKIQTTMEYLKIVPADQGKELLKINFD